MHPKNSKGFTLIELLVVIAILALLMALVVSVVQRALNRARTVACAGNLRNIGIAFYTYASAQQSFPPPAGHVTGGSLPNPSFWYSSLGPYLGLSWDQGSGPNPGDPSFGNTGLSCSAYGSKRLGYAYNEFLPPSHRSAWVPKVTPAKWTIDQSTRTSERLLAGDATAWYTGGPDLITFSGTSLLDWFRHGDGANLLFLDGHVQRHNKEYISQNREILFFFDVL